MMGERTGMQEALFYGFSVEQHVPQSHMLRAIDRFIDLSELRAHLSPFYSHTGRPSIDPELLIRMLIIGYCMGIRSERRLCEEVHLSLAECIDKERCVFGRLMHEVREVTLSPAQGRAPMAGKPCRPGKTHLEEFNYVPAVALRRDPRDKVIELIDDCRGERTTGSLEPPFIREGKHCLF